MNWSTLILELIDSGLTQIQIAKQVPTTQSYVSDLKRGHRTNPSHHVGTALIELHRICVLEKQPLMAEPEPQ